MSIAFRISRNLSFILWARLLSVMVSLTFLAIAARFLGVVDFGKLIFVLATTSLMEMAFAGTVDSILVREQAKQPGGRDANFRACASIQFCFSLTLVAVCLALAAYFRDDASLSRGLVLAGLASAFQVLFCVPVAFFRAEENMFYEASLITAERTLFLLCFLGVVALRGGIVPLLGCLLLSMGMKAIVGYIWFFRRYPIARSHAGWDKLGYFWVESLPLLGVSLLLSIHWRVDLFLTKAVSSAEQLGIYAASFRTMEMLRVMPIDAITAAFPILCKLAAEGNENLARTYGGLVKVALILGIFVTGLGVTYSQTVTRVLFGTPFLGAVWPLRTLLLAFPLVCLNQIHNITLTATHRQRRVFYALLGALAIQILLDLVLIPQRGAVGAGAGFAAGELAFLLGTLLAIVPLSLNLRAVSATAIRVLLASLTAFLIGSYIRSWSPVLGFVLIAALYVVLLRLLRAVSGDDLVIVRQTVNHASQRFRSLSLATIAGSKD